MDATRASVYQGATTARVNRPAMAERDVRSRPEWWRHAMKKWLVPPVVFPIFLILLIVGYVILRTPT